MSEESKRDNTRQETSAAIGEYNTFVLAHTWRNLWLNASDGIFYAMGQALAPAATVLPGFISDIAARVEGLGPYKNRLVGLLGLIMSICFMMPQQIWAARMTEVRTRLKRLLIYVAALERVPWLVMGVMTLLVAPRHPEAALYLFFAIVFSYHFILGVVSPVWQETVAKVTPVNKRGLLFGVRESIGGVLGLLTLVVAGRYVPGLPFPTNYAVLFLGMFVLITLSWGTLFFLKEAEYPVKRPHRGTGEHMRDILGILRGDGDFQRYFLSRSFYSLSQVAATSFFAVRAIEVIGEAATVKLMVKMTMVVTIARSLSILVGPLGDRHGYRVVLALANATAAGGIVCALLATGEWGFYAAYALSTVSMMAFWCGHSNYILEIAPIEKRPSYISLDNMSGLPFVAAPLIGGHLNDVLGSYTATFVAGAALAAVGAVMFMTVAVDPRKRRSGELVA